MTFDEFFAKAAANNCPFTLNKFEQKAYLPKGDTGSCASLSTVWLRFRHDKEARKTTLEDIKSLDRREEIQSLKTAYERNNNLRPLADHLGAYGYRQSGVEIFHNPSIIDSLHRALLCPGYYLIGFSGKGGGHMIAVDGVSFAIFDPNHGEMKLDSSAATASCARNLILMIYPKLIDTEASYARFLHY